MGPKSAEGPVADPLHVGLSWFGWGLTAVALGVGALALWGLLAIEEGRQLALAFGCAGALVHIVRAAVVGKARFAGPAEEGTIGRSVFGTLPREASVVRQVLLMREAIRLDATASALLVRRRSEGGFPVGQGSPWRNLIAWPLLGLGTAAFQYLSGGHAALVGSAILGVWGGVLVIYIVFDPPAGRRRESIPWESVLAAIETREGVDIHYSSSDGPRSLCVALDRYPRARLLAKLSSRTRLLTLAPLDPLERFLRDEPLLLDPETVRATDETIDEFRRM